MFKKFGRGLSSTVLKVLLYTLAVVVALLVVFGTSAHLKHALVKSNVYNTFIDNVLDEAQKSADTNTSSQDNGGITLDQPLVREAAKKAVSPALLQSSAEGALNGIYGWLQQKTPTPQFTIDLTQAKQTFASSVGDSLATRIQSLPVCTAAQLRALDVNNIDLLTIPCRSPGVNLETERQKVVANLSSSKDFLEKPVVTAQDLPKNDQGKTVVDELQQMPQAFHWLMIAPWAIAVIALFCIGLVVWLFEDKHQALRSLWITFLSVGLILLLSFWITSWTFDKISKSPKLTSNGAGFQETGVNLAKALTNDVNQVILVFAIIYLAIAAVIGGIWWWLGKQHPAPASEPAPAHTGKTPPKSA